MDTPKGVICKIEEPENMPVDADGNRADVIMDNASVIARMNIGKLYEHYLGGAARDVTKQVCKILGVKANVTQDRIETIDKSVRDDAYRYLMHFYQLCSSRQFEFFKNLSDEEKCEHLKDVVNEGVYIYYPIDNDKDIVEMVKNIEKTFKPTYGPVSYVGDSGQRTMTKEKVRIAPLYLMLLDKIADDWSAVSSGRQQHFGVLSPMNKSEKFAFPFRNSPVRTIGETEGRIFAGYCGVEAIAEMMDRSNNPMTQRNMVWNILNSETPGHIDKVVDREFIPLGGSKPLQLVKHIFNVSGMGVVYEPEDPAPLKPEEK